MYVKCNGGLWPRAAGRAGPRPVVAAVSPHGTGGGHSTPSRPARVGPLSRAPSLPRFVAGGGAAVDASSSRQVSRERTPQR